MPILFRQTSHDIAFGYSPIEKMGGDNIVRYSWYGVNGCVYFDPDVRIENM